MIDKICLFGDGGHASVLKDIATLNNRVIEAIFDDVYQVEKVEKGILYSNLEAGINYVSKEPKQVIIGIGSLKIRRDLALNLQNTKAKFINLIHPNAIISPSVKMGTGNVLMPGSIVNANTVIGNHCIVNTAATVDHDCYLGDFSQLSPGVHICGGVKVNSFVNIGAGAVVIPQLTIEESAVIGAGAVVIKNIEKKSTVVGVPGIRIK